MKLKHLNGLPPPTPPGKKKKKKLQHIINRSQTKL